MNVEFRQRLGGWGGWVVVQTNNRVKPKFRWIVSGCFGFLLWLSCGFDNFHSSSYYPGFGQELISICLASLFTTKPSVVARESADWYSLGNTPVLPTFMKPLRRQPCCCVRIRASWNARQESLWGVRRCRCTSSPFPVIAKPNREEMPGKSEKSFAEFLPSCHDRLQRISSDQVLWGRLLKMHSKSQR